MMSDLLDKIARIEIPNYVGYKAAEKIEQFIFEHNEALKLELISYFKEGCMHKDEAVIELIKKVMK